MGRGGHTVNSVSQSDGARNFRFRAVTLGGTVTTGVLVASNRARAVEAIRARGQWPIKIDSIEEREVRAIRMSVADIGLGFRVLASIIDARVPIGRIMTIAAPSLPVSWQLAVPRISGALESGETFSTSLSRTGLRISATILGLLGAGEAAGDLGGALRRSAELAERSARTRAAIISSLAYPLLLLLASGGVIGLLVIVVIPRFVEVLASLGQELPASTRLVMAIASLLRHGFVPVSLLAGVATLVVATGLRSVKGRQRWHQFLLSLPIVGPLRKSIATARFTDALSALLESGMTVSLAFPFAAAASGDAVIESRLLRARVRIVEGETIARAVSEANALTESATRLIGAGESGGAVAVLLRHAALLESEGATARIRRLMSVLEPSLILLLGAVVSSVAVALLQAVYSVRADRL